MEKIIEFFKIEKIINNWIFKIQNFNNDEIYKELENNIYEFFNILKNVKCYYYQHFFLLSKKIQIIKAYIIY